MANYTGVKSHTSNYFEIAVAVVEAVLLFGFAIPLWAARVDHVPSESEALVVQVTAEQFAWNVHYAGPDGVFGRTDIKLLDLQSNPLGLDRADPAAKDDVTTLNQLYLPVNKPIIVRLRSKDVIHSFGVPEFRVKQDAVPGLTIPIWFVPNVTTAEMRTRTGNPEFQYQIACAQLCGLGHVRMRGFVTVQTAEEFQKWMADEVRAERTGPQRRVGPLFRLKATDSSYPNIFGVGIRARIRSSSVDGHAVEAALAAGLLDGPDDHAADERGDLLHALGRRIVPRDRRRRFGAVLDCRRPARPADDRRDGPGWREGATRRTSPACGCRGGLRPSDRRSSRRPGRGSRRSGRSSRTPRTVRRARAAANAVEQLRGGPEVRETRAAKGPREDREVGARGDIPVRPYPHVVRPRRAPAGSSGVGPDRRQTGTWPRRSASAGDRCGRRAGILQNGLDVVRSALRVHEHPAVVLPLDPVERGENLVVLRRG